MYPCCKLSATVPRSTATLHDLRVIEHSTFGAKVEKSLLVCSLNVQSLRNKAMTLVISELVPSDYDFKHVPQANQKRGGGIRIMYSIKYSVISHSSFKI